MPEDTLIAETLEVGKVIDPPVYEDGTRAVDTNDEHSHGFNVLRVNAPPGKVGTRIFKLSTGR